MRVMDYIRMYADDHFPRKARERTIIWTSMDWFPDRPLCNKDCGDCIDGRHIDLAQRGPSPGVPGNRHSLQELYAIPPELARDILRWAELN